MAATTAIHSSMSLSIFSLVISPLPANDFNLLLGPMTARETFSGLMVMTVDASHCMP